jgi:hypothetical protein
MENTECLVYWATMVAALLVAVVGVLQNTI